MGSKNGGKSRFRWFSSKGRWLDPLQLFFGVFKVPAVHGFMARNHFWLSNRWKLEGFVFSLVHCVTLGGSFGTDGDPEEGHSLVMLLAPVPGSVGQVYDFHDPFTWLMSCFQNVRSESFTSCEVNVSMLMVLLWSMGMSRGETGTTTSHHITSRQHFCWRWYERSWPSWTPNMMWSLERPGWLNLKRNNSFQINLEKFPAFLNDKNMLGRVVWCHFLEVILIIPSEKSRLPFIFVPVYHPDPVVRLVHSVGARDKQEHVTSNQLLVDRKKLKRCTNGSRSFYRSWDISGVAQDGVTA